MSHVCRHWREIALNQPLFWSHLCFTNFSLAGAGEMLARAKMAPLHLEARDLGYWNDAQFSAFQKQIRMHASHISHLDISADFDRFSGVVKGLVSPVPILESLSLFCTGIPNRAISSGVSITDTVFDGTAPGLSYLKLRKCNISWKSSLLKGLKYLEMHYPSASGRPSLSVWLDALDAMPQLQILIFTMLPRSPFLLHLHLVSSTPSHSPPFQSWFFLPRREIVGSPSHILSYQLSLNCASQQDLNFETAAM